MCIRIADGLRPGELASSTITYPRTSSSPSSISAPFMIFAIRNSAFIADLALPSWLLVTLIQYHTSPSNLTFADLKNKRAHTCSPTLLPNKPLEITMVDKASSIVEINQDSIIEIVVGL
ncbi:hypothetical protein Scep_030248 [Stephania cephalantha]|uniref:FAS1 domain-containing protein n=1 Tax=Stephania cephalantha TaxID=152367 RepID=A0AAP0E3Q2_9MAGN